MLPQSQGSTFLSRLKPKIQDREVGSEGAWLHRENVRAAAQGLRCWVQALALSRQLQTSSLRALRGVGTVGIQAPHQEGVEDAGT